MTDRTTASEATECITTTTTATEGCGPAVIECPVIKTEQKDCLLCTSRAGNHYDVFWTETREGHSPLIAYICRVAEVQLARVVEDTGGGVACHTCVELINVLERAELEYFRLKDSFSAIIAGNPSFESPACGRDVKEVVVVKREVGVELSNQAHMRVRKDSDDEPLALRKKRGRKSSKQKVFKEENGASAEELTVVKNEDDNDHRQSLGFKLDLESDHNIDWANDSAISDSEYEPPVTKLRRKNSSLENGRKQRNSQPKKRSFDVPIVREIAIETLVKHAQDCEKSKQRKRVEDGQKKRKSKDKTELHRCKECAAQFHSIIRLQAHMTKHEAMKGPFICEICGAHYKHKKACDVHVKMHKGISDWKCEECNKLFPSKGALHRHNAIHTGKANYQCDLCGKSFIHTSSFKMHKLSHTGLKPHKCDVCGLALMTRSHLKRHKRIHSGEKRHECSLCGKRFSERYNLLAHHKSHALEEAGIKPTGTVRKPWQGFRCNLCDKRFERRYMLEKHMEVVHQRIMEKGPPRPRNTMTKLLKAQAAAVAKTTVQQVLPTASEHPRADQSTQIDSSILQNLLTKNTGTSTASAAEESGPDVKPRIVAQSDDEDNSSDESARPAPAAAATASAAATSATSSREEYVGLRLPNGTWSSGSYIASEYSSEFQQ